MPTGKTLESRSRAIFKETLSPWLVTDWTEHDYGIDAIVELTRDTATGQVNATAKRFAVQLKSTAADSVSLGGSVPVRVRPEQIRYWIESTEPVLLVLCHIPSRQLFCRWIDHVLVEELNGRDPSWIGQETVTVVVPTSRAFDDLTRSEIAEVVTNYNRAGSRLLAPGEYVALHEQIAVLASDLTSRAKEAGFESVRRRLADLESSVRTSTYVVALTGPARAGKSSLLNALVGREVSPVGRLPTTAVSLLVVAGAQDESEVLLADGERIRGTADAAFLDQYATQEKNPDNLKGVRIVTVRLVSALLERGIAYADAPGLYDPSPEIRAITETALKAAHAVLYVLDVSPAKNGGFSLTNHQLDDLKRLRALAEKVFVVLNKADVLSDAEKEEVNGYLRQALTKYGSWDVLPVAPLFVSASSACLWQQTGRIGESPVVELEKALWTHLLQTNATGVDRLRVAAKELHRGGEEFASLLATRRLSGSEAFRLRTALENCRVTEQRLVGLCRERRGPDEDAVAGRLGEYRAALIARLRHNLSAIPLDREMPTARTLEGDLQVQVMKVLEDVWLEASARFQTFAASISQEVEASLQQARLRTGAREDMAFVLPPVPPLSVAADSFEEAWTGLFTGGLVGIIFGGPWAWVLAAGGWLAGFVFGRDRRRKREIDRVVARVDAAIEDLFVVIQSQLREKIAIYLGALERHATDRISVFVHDVEGQLQKLETPIGPDEAVQLEEAEKFVRRTLKTISGLSEQLVPGRANE